MGNPYGLPPGYFYAVSFSGGRSSAYMLAHILDANGGMLPGHVVVCFCNTGREHPNTLNFVRDCQQHFGVDIHWLEFRYDQKARGVRGQPKFKHAVVDFATASRDGRPFDELLIAKRGMLPSQQRRFCTQEMKVRTIQRHMNRDLGVKEYVDVVGLRADEGKRIFDMLARPCSKRPGKHLPKFPMADAGVTKQTVLDYWKRMPFDLDLDPALGNCDLCFMKARRMKARVLQIMPEIADWWHDHEKRNIAKRHMEKRQLAQWDEFTPISRLREMAKQGDLFDVEGDPGIDCGCTD